VVKSNVPPSRPRAGLQLLAGEVLEGCVSVIEMSLAAEEEFEMFGFVDLQTPAGLGQSAQYFQSAMSQKLCIAKPGGCWPS
jgi:hypothetical protein